MKNKLKLVVIFVALFSMIFAFSSCGAPVKGEVFDGGNIEVFVPEGWKAFHGADVFGDYEEGYNPNVVSIGKGVEDEFELYSKPMVHITYSGKDRTLNMPPKELYENSKDIKDIKTDQYTWKGYTAISMGYPIAVLFTEFGNEQIQVSVTMENGDMKIDLNDADFKAILEGIKVKNK